VTAGGLTVKAGGLSVIAGGLTVRHYVFLVGHFLCISVYLFSYGPLRLGTVRLFRRPLLLLYFF
jgi:hypothetical protein